VIERIKTLAGAFDFKKEYKDLYLPTAKPNIIDVPKMVFIMVDGKGNPNTCEAYKNAVGLVYALSYSIKMSKMRATQPRDYFEYIVPPLEGLWWGEGNYFDESFIQDKDRLHWTSMIRQPEFAVQEVYEEAKIALGKKKPELDLSLARLVSLAEGLCVQIMHVGSYDDEPATIEVLNKFIAEMGYKNDISTNRKHHEIYLGDPRKTIPEKLKTVIRHPIVRC